jgi:hypothetical protein
MDDTLEYQFKQPFSKDFGIDEGQPSSDFKNFINGDNIYDVYIGFTRIVRDADEYMDTLTNLFGITNKTCIAQFTFIDYSSHYYTLGSLLREKYHPLRQIEYDYSFIPFVPYIDIDILSELNSKLNSKEMKSLEMIYLSNMKGLKTIKKCQKQQYLYKINISLYFIDKNKRHSLQIIVNPKNSSAYILESSEIDDVLTAAENFSVSTFLQTYVDPNINLKIRDTHVCSKIQGNTTLCATWNFYLFILVLLNPHLTSYDIIEIFSRYSQDERNFLILQFMFYTHSLLKNPDMFFYRLLFDDGLNQVKNDQTVVIPRAKTR